MSERHSRRRVLRAFGALALGSLAGCPRDGDGDGSSQRSTATGGPSTATATDASEPTATPYGTDGPPGPTERSSRDPTRLDASGTWPQYQRDARNASASPDVTAVPAEGTPYWRRYDASCVPALADDWLYLDGSAGEDATAVLGASATTGEERWMGPERTGFHVAPAVGEAVYGPDAAFDRETGEQVWTATVSGGLPAGPPTLADGRPFLARGSGLGDTAAVLALDTGGRTVWTREFPSDVDLDAHVAVDGRRVFAATTADDGRGEVVALDRTNGDRLWTAPTDAPVATAPTVGAGSVFVADADGGVHAFAVDGGDRYWRRSFPRPGGGGFAHVTGELYYASRAGVHRLDPVEGTESWREPTGRAAPPAVGAEAVYFGTRGDGPRLYALDRESGERRWSHPFPEFVVRDVAQGGVRLAPALADGGLFVLADDGLYAFGPA